MLTIKRQCALALSVSHAFPIQLVQILTNRNKKTQAYIDDDKVCMSRDSK